MLEMDTHLSDPLNLDSAMSQVDFGQAEDVVVSDADILGAENHEDINMAADIELEHIVEQPMLMETDGEEIIVPDLMTEEFTLSSNSTYAQDDQMTGSVTLDGTDEQQNIFGKPGTTMNLQFVPQTSGSSVDFGQELQAVIHPQIITVQNNQQQINRPVTLQQLATLRPKPMTITTQATLKPKTVVATKPYPMAKPLAIAPKPMSLVKSAGVPVMKKMSMTNIQSVSKPGSMIAQIGKQLVVLPPNSARKLKLIPSDISNKLQQLNNDDGLIKTKNVPMQKAFLTKVLLQGSSQPESETVGSQNQSAVLTKIGSVDSQSPATARFISIHQKNIAPSANTVFATSSPKKHGNEIVKIVKNREQLTFVKSPTSKMVTVPTTGVASKKIIITPSPNQNVLLKSMPTKQTQVVVSGTQHTQLHPINVPGKGVQYIRLVTNPTNTATKPVVTGRNQTVFNVQPKTFLMSDGKGNLIISSADKMSQPPPLVMTGGPVISKVNSRPQQKLVRIAPIGSKISQIGTVPPINRSAQSLLAPIVSEDPLTSPATMADGTESSENTRSLRSIIEEAVMEETTSDTDIDINDMPHQDVEIEIDREQSPEVRDNSITDYNENSETHETQQRPMIIIKPEYMDNGNNNESMQMHETVISIEEQNVSKYSQYSESPMSPPVISETELMVRSRKACNCTKSQCLKLYCDCFANGEFCNSCNCTNCHNNLENEELRQKAIRGCLERNPNAFRPKIGKAKISAGPDTVRRHNKGCNCKRSGCLKNYCECYEAKIACTAICKCLGCRNVEETVERLRRREPPSFERRIAPRPPSAHTLVHKQPCSFVTSEVIEAVCQCLVAAAIEGGEGGGGGGARPPFTASNGQTADCGKQPATLLDEAEAVRAVIEEFSRCLQDIVNAANHTTPMALLSDEVDT